MTSKPFQAFNPATGEPGTVHPFIGDAEVNTILENAETASHSWSQREVEERAQICERISELFLERSEELARIATMEMGKPIEEMREEIEFCHDIFRYFAAKGPQQLQDTILEETAEGTSVLQRRAIGPLLGIMPWNYPYYQVARFVAPNLITGNTIILKHAEICPESALAIEKLFHDAGVPTDAYQNIFATYDQVSEMIGSSVIQGISLTGSERAGSVIAEQAGHHLKKVVLELGGSDPYVILSTNDVAAHAKHALDVRMENTGQACNSNKRIIVMEDIFDEFVDELKKLTQKLSPGNPLDEQPNSFGPLSSEAAARSLLEQIEDAKTSGATVHHGGERLPIPGYYVSPAILTDVTPNARAYREELFGPALVIYKVSSEEEALRLANDTIYGLGASVYASEPGRAEAFADRIQAGMVGANAQAPETADMPFGGIKRSGYGRELGPLGIDEFVNKRLLHVAKV